MLRSVAIMMAMSVASAFPGSTHDAQALVQTAQSGRDRSDTFEGSTNMSTKIHKLSTSDAYTVKYDNQCELAFSYMPALGNAADSRPCVGIQLFETPPDCDGLNDTTLPCIAQAVSGIKSVNKDKKIETQQERSELIELSMQIEGSGYGASASASTNAAISSTSSHSSVIFSAFMGATDIFTVRIKNYQKMKLKPQYAEQLEAEPGTFFDQYGYFFINKIVYGASFTGLISFTESQSATSVSTKTTISVDYNSLAKADASLETQTKQMSKSMKVESTTSAYGGKIQPMGAMSLKSILDVRTKWWDDLTTKCSPGDNESAQQVMVRCTAKMQKMGFTKMTAIDHVQRILRKAGKDPFEFCKVKIPSADVRNRLAKELVECNLFSRSLRNYEMDNSIRRLQDQGFTFEILKDFNNSITSLSQKYKSHMQELEALTLDTAPAFSSFPCSAGDFSFQLEAVLASSGLPPKLKECPPDDKAYACCSNRRLADGESKWPCLANSGAIDFGDLRATDCNVDFKPNNAKRNQPCKIRLDECPDENHCKIDALRACKDIPDGECELGLPGNSCGRPSSCKRPCKVSLARVHAYKQCMADGRNGATCKDNHMDMCEVFSHPPIDCGCGHRGMNPYGQNCYCNYFSANCGSGFTCKGSDGHGSYFTSFDNHEQFRKCQP